MRTGQFTKIVMVAMVFASIMVVYALTYPSPSTYVRNVGTVKTLGVGVYWDSGCSQPVSSINWGMVEPGAVKTVTVYIKNEGNAPITLSLRTSNWNPPKVVDYISLSWNYNSQAINANQAIKVTLSLFVLPNIQGVSVFSFDVIIVAVG